MPARRPKLRLAVDLEPELINRLHAQAEGERRTLTSIVTFALETYLSTHPLQEQQ